METATVTRSHVGCRRKINEDSVLARPDLRLWAVADGMGGHSFGDVASAMVVDGLATAPPGLGLDAAIDAARERLDRVNAQLVAMGGEGPQRKTIGSTVVALLLDERAFTCLWAGDSRIYLVRNGSLRQLTRDHSLVQMMIDVGELTPEQARDHPNANVITRAVGSTQRLELDLAAGPLWGGDLFLLASDGLTRLVDDQELLGALEAERLEQSADGLLQTCLERGAPDNVSFVLVRLSPAA